MKRLITVCSLAFIPVLMPVQTAAHAENPDPIQTVAVTCGNDTGTAKLYGNGQNFIKDLKVTVEFKNHPAYDIKLEDGYSPFISVFDFGAQDKFLFTSSQTGGSGGYGNYCVYRLETSSYQLLYDDKTESKSQTYGAVFQPDGFMQITNNATNYTLAVSVGYMDKYFYGKIFAPDGSLKGEQPYINDISFVSPSLNAADGIFRLTTYRSVTAVAEVNRLGYIVRTLGYENGAFVTEFTEFSISL